MTQSAIDISCDASDFTSGVNRVVISHESPNARRYLKLPFYFDLVSYGSNIVASTSENFADIAREYIDKYEVAHCFETPNLHVINDALLERGYNICFMAEYFLPDVDKLRVLPIDFETRLLTQPDFAKLYTPEWSNALCENRKQLDVLGVGAYDGDRLIGLAACSADCETMYQIGIDVLPDYRRRGIASALVSRLALEILERGIVPFYCAAWSNIPSVRCAIDSGFRPSWVEVTAKPIEFTKSMNK